MKFNSTAFAPGHVTIIFSIRDQHQDLLEKGSIGVGFSIDKGVKTQIEIRDGKKQEISIKINGLSAEASVTRAVVNQFSQYLKNKKIKINHDIDFPVSAGFGASGAGALSTAFALNQLFGNVFDDKKCGQIAHKAEVMNKTGLGDVIGQFHGGFEIRIKEGAPGIGKLKNLNVAKDMKVILGTWGILETKSVLTNPKNRNLIIKTGENILKMIFQKKDLELGYICNNAQEFSRKIDLESEELKEVITLLNQNGYGTCGMVMLGNSFFCFSKEEEIKDILSIINQLKSKPSIIISEIPKSGVKIL